MVCILVSHISVLDVGYMTHIAMRRGMRLADTVFLTLPVALLQTWIGMRCSHPGCALSQLYCVVHAHRVQVPGLLHLSTFICWFLSAQGMMREIGSRPGASQRSGEHGHGWSAHFGSLAGREALLCGVGPQRAERAAAGGSGGYMHVV